MVFFGFGLTAFNLHALPWLCNATIFWHNYCPEFVESKTLGRGSTKPPAFPYAVIVCINRGAALC